MAQNFKDIRTKGIAALTEMSKELAKLSANEAISASSKAFVDACKELEHDEVCPQVLSIVKPG